DGPIAALAHVFDNPAFGSVIPAEVERIVIGGIDHGDNFIETRHDRDPAGDLAPLRSAPGRRIRPVLFQVPQSGDQDVFLVTPAEIDILRYATRLDDLPRQMAELHQGVASPEKQHGLAGGRALEQSYRRLLRVEIEAVVAVLGAA